MKIAALVMVLALAGCVSQPYPDRRFYAVDAGEVVKVEKGGSEVTLRVAPVRVVPPFDAVTFTYKVGASEYRADYYHAFVAPLPKLLTEQMARWLDESGGVKYAMSAEMRMPAMYNVETTVTDFYADVRDAKNPKGVIEVRVVVLDERGAGGTRVVLKKVYRGETAVKELGNAEKLVEAWSESWREVLKQVSADMAGLPGVPNG